MRSVSALAVAVIIGASAVTAACGQQRPGPIASGTAASSPPAAACGAMPAVLGPGRTLTLSMTDSSRSFCVRRGTGVLIYLRGTATHKWGPLKSSSAVLVPSANGHLSLARCGPAVPPTVPATSGKASCGSIELFRVTIRVA